MAKHITRKEFISPGGCQETHISRQEGYIPPKRPYSFLAMLDDILEFAALSLVDNGRLSFWMPTSNEEDQEIHPPAHPYLVVTSICTQSFNKCKNSSPADNKCSQTKGSRRLITYQRLPDAEVPQVLINKSRHLATGVSADDLNPFRKRYFEGFRP
jgi:tRNA (guanine10-N2)-methyltransferase